MSLGELTATIQLVGSIGQLVTAGTVAVIAVMTFRYTKRQNSLNLINQNNSLANLVNTTTVQSGLARDTFGKLQDFIVGCPDDAILFMYLSYVHSTFRTYQIGAISKQVWADTLASCVMMLGRLRRDQVARLLARGYEEEFQAAVLARYDAMPSTIVTPLRPSRMALAS